MSLTVVISDLGTLAAVEKRLQRLSAMDLRALLEGIGAEVESQTRRRISEEKRAPDGTEWPEWSFKYAAKKHGPFKNHDKHPEARRESQGHSLLELTGHMLDSIQYEVDRDEVRIGSNMVYAAHQQFGGDGIPAREFLGLSTENERDIESLVNNFIEEALR